MGISALAARLVTKALIGGGDVLGVDRVAGADVGTRQGIELALQPLVLEVVGIEGNHRTDPVAPAQKNGADGNTIGLVIISCSKGCRRLDFGAVGDIGVVTGIFYHRSRSRGC